MRLFATCLLLAGCASAGTPPSQPVSQPTETEPTSQSDRAKLLRELDQLANEGQAAMTAKKYAEAASLFQRVSNLNYSGALLSLQPEFQYHAARALMWAGDHQQALAWLEKASRTGYANSKNLDREIFSPLHKDDAWPAIKARVADNPRRLSRYTITEWNNPDLFKGPEHLFIDRNSDFAKNLRAQYKGPELPNDDEQAIAVVLNWVHRQWAHSGLQEPTRRDAVTILKEVKAGHRFRCVEYSVVVAELLQALGIPARVVQLRRSPMAYGLGRGHVVAEAWSDTRQKWFVIDGQNNGWWTLKGVPQSAADLQDLLSKQRLADLKFAHQGSNWLKQAPKEEVWRSYFANLVMSLDNRRYPEPGSGQATWLLTPSGRPPELLFQGQAHGARHVSDPNAVYPVLNRVHVDLKPGPGDEVLVALSHSAPWLVAYEINGIRLPASTASWTWKLRPGSQRMEVRAVLPGGRTGAATVVALDYTGSSVSDAE